MLGGRLEKEPGVQLWYASTSPFARKVRIAAHELDLDRRIALVETNPWTSPDLRKLNPLAKVPTLVLDDGEILFESSVICDYLDSLAPSRRLFPEAGTVRWRALRLQGLADGAATAAGRLYADEHRPRDERSETTMDRLRQALGAALDAGEANPPPPDDCAIGAIAMAALLGYLDFRWPERDWRSARPGLAAWFATFSARPSMIATEHRPARIL